MTDPTSDRSGATRNQQILHDSKERFRRTGAGADAFLRFLDRSGVEAWKFKQDSIPSQWWINVTLPADKQKVFGLDREIQVLFTEYEKVQPRALSLIQGRVLKDMRVEPDVAILVSRDDHIKDTVRRRAGEMAIIAVNLNEIAVGDSPMLHTLIAQSIATIDHFDVVTPITEPSGFYGRQAEIETIANDLKRAVSVGLFGLRKAGKTSLLNAVAALRSDDVQNVTVRIDVSEIVTAEQFRSTVLERLWAEVHKIPGNEDIRPRLRTLTRQGKLRTDIADSSTSWIGDFRALLEYVDNPTVLIVDEIDQAFPPRSNLDANEAQALFRSLVQLRSVIQEQDQLALLCAGVDPALFERPLFDGKDNLLYKLVRLVWLAPMNRDEIAEMVRSLGRRMGVRVRGHEQIDALFARYGGHPLLTRKACSIAVRARTPETLPFHITQEVIEKAMSSRDYGGPYEQAADVLASFTQWFPAEASLMQLHFSHNSEERDLASMLLTENPNAMVHSIAYGLCFPDHTARIAAAIESLEH